jgi:hypothetical protein
MGKMFQNASLLKLLGQLKVETKLPKRNNWSYVKTMSCSGSHLGITINIKNTKFVLHLVVTNKGNHLLITLCLVCSTIMVKFYEKL